MCSHVWCGDRMTPHVSDGSWSRCRLHITPSRRHIVHLKPLGWDSESVNSLFLPLVYPMVVSIHGWGFFLSLLPRLLAGILHRGQLRVFKSSHWAWKEPTIGMSKELPWVKGCRSWVKDEKLQGTWGKGKWSRAGWVPSAKFWSQKRQQHVIGPLRCVRMKS